MRTITKALPMVLLTAIFAVGCLGEPDPSTDEAQAPEGSGVGEATEALASGTIYDGPGQNTYNVCNGMHCCPVGWAMVGIHVGDNIFSCREAISNPQHEYCYVDRGTVRDGMHACGEGYYMKGANIGQNTFTCCLDAWGDSTGTEDVNTSTNDGYMHTCVYAYQEAMTGLNVSANLLLCQQWFGVAQ